MRTVLLLRKSAESEKLIFNAIKKKILDYLASLEKKEKAAIEKAFSKMLMLAKGGKGLPVGTVRDWKGKKFIKTAPGKWKPKYESHSRGAKLAISALKKKIAACDTAKDMMNVMLENRDRFSDKNGNPLPFVQELSKFIDETQENHVRFTDNGAEKKWYEKPPATEKELLDFAKRAIEENANERLFVGYVSSEAQKRIKEATGLDAKSIILDSNSVRHVMNKEAHNLELEDLKYMQEVINDPSSIKLSEQKYYHNAVIEFRKDISGEITFVEEFRAKRGQLELVTCYRKKRKSAANASMLRKSTSPETNVLSRNDGQINTSIPQSDEKSSIRKAG
ncbi:hypothetical protein [Treponema phagedenis]|uniref:PBECR3 domain-containing polyvalent protein n=1 Tax=Treponema phagedenis TaxID=162 RepID=UPI001581D1AD|nr:hypothetical protein [Treponema phagedenis]QKS91957.1 hypothetical protein HPJ96_04885 [Treponema phagedenis]QKS92434.1 hypothetical protein HPJ96_07695 [Treponema phagedenis]